MKFKLFFALYDLWVGLYYDRTKRVLYVNPLPCIVLSFAADSNRWNEDKQKWEVIV